MKLVDITLQPPSMSPDKDTRCSFFRIDSSLVCVDAWSKGMRFLHSIEGGLGGMQPKFSFRFFRIIMM